MVVDDNTTNLNIAKAILENDYNVILIPNGEKALQTIPKTTPDLILLDILMPKMNGYSVIKEIIELGPPYNTIPVIFLTSKTDDESEVLGLNLGAVDYIRKPFSAPILLKRLELHLKFQNQNKELLEQKQQLLEQKQQLTEYSSLLEENVVELKSQNFLNDTMIKCIATLVQEESIEISMYKLLEIITNYYGAVTTKILYKATNSNNIRSYFSYTNLKDKNKDKRLELPMDQAIAFFNKFDVDGIACVNSIDEVADNPLLHQVFIENYIKTLLFVPLVHLNVIVGFLGVQNHTKSIEDIIMIKNISAFIVNHIIKHNLLNELEELSFHDTLTGLYNRNYYNNYVDKFVIEPNNKMGIIFGDINGLKIQNDNYGHESGDRLIKETSVFLMDNLDGLIFRIGGDEFVCFYDNITKTDFDNIVANLINKIDQTESISISIGTTWSENFDDIQHIIAYADKNMYENKNNFYKEQNKNR